MHACLPTCLQTWWSSTRDPTQELPPPPRARAPGAPGAPLQSSFDHFSETLFEPLETRGHAYVSPPPPPHVSSLTPPNRTEFIPFAGGDETVRTRVYDMAAAVRPHNPVQWPEPYDSSGVASNDFTAKWHTREVSLGADLAIRCVRREPVVCVVIVCLALAGERFGHGSASARRFAVVRRGKCIFQA